MTEKLKRKVIKEMRRKMDRIYGEDGDKCRVLVPPSVALFEALSLLNGLVSLLEMEEEQKK